MKVVFKTNPMGDSLKASMAYSKKMSTVVFIIVAAVFLGVSAAMYVGYAYTSHIGMLICGIFLTAVGIAFPVLVLLFLLPYIRRKQAEALEFIDTSIVYVFNDDGFIRSHMASGQTKQDEFQYSALKKVTETDKALILFTEDKEMRLPKSSIIEGEIPELTDHLKSILGKRYY